jgi:hypothetical protein
MPDEYTPTDGIKYHADGFAHCNRCGSIRIVNRLCVFCDVEPSKGDTDTAEAIRKHCDLGVSHGGVVARIIAAMRVPPLHCGGCGKCLDCLRRERGNVCVNK